MTDSFYAWSPTASENDDADSTINWLENQDPDTVNNSARAMMARAAEFRKDITIPATSSGAANAYEITPSSGVTPAAYPDGYMVAVLPHQTNTGAATLKVGALAAKNLRITSATSLSAGDIVLNKPFIARYRSSSDEFLMDAANVSGALTSLSGTAAGQIRWAKGADVASAAALTLGTDGNSFDITGTTTITSIDTLGVGTIVLLQFDAALTLTHHATDLILPGSANIATAAGDVGLFWEYATGDWQCINFQPAAASSFNLVDDTTPQAGGTLDMNSQQIRTSKGADVASAATLTLGDDGNTFDITGTTTITAIAAKTVGTLVRLQFDAALTLTHHATDLILPGGANITTAAGDIAIFEEYASGDWRCISYSKASGEAVVASSGGAWEYIGAVTASNDATVAFTDLTSAYAMYMVLLDEVVPASDNKDLYIRTSTDNGSSYDSGSGNYYYGYHENTASNATGKGASDTEIVAAPDVGSASNEGISGVVYIVNPSAANYTRLFGQFAKHDYNGFVDATSFAGSRLSAADVDAVQFLFESGNIESGTFKLYGLAAS